MPIVLKPAPIEDPVIEKKVSHTVLKALWLMFKILGYLLALLLILGGGFLAVPLAKTCDWFIKAFTKYPASTWFFTVFFTSIVILTWLFWPLIRLLAF